MVLEIQKKRYKNCNNNEGVCSKCHLVINESDCQGNPINKLAYRRTLAGYSQNDLSNKSNIPIGNIRNWEQNRRNIINARVGQIINLAKALGCSVEELV